MYALETHDLGRKYGDYWAVRDLTLQIKQGEVFGLLGPNGAGKTTIMRMLACIIAPSEGSARVAGYDVHDESNAVRSRVGILTEAPGLYSNRTAKQNLEFFARLQNIPHDKIAYQVERYLRLLGLWENRNARAGTFSKGMKQKLSMARALLHEPPVVILDEPTSALDAEGAKLVRDFIGTLQGEGRTILLCTHNLPEAQSLCDRVAIFKGTLLRVDTPAQLRRSLYRRQVEVSIQNLGQGRVSEEELRLRVALLDGVDDVTIRDGMLFATAAEPEQVAPDIVEALVAAGARVERVTEVEHTLEKAYLDLVGATSADVEAQALEEVAA